MGSQRSPAFLSVSFIAAFWSEKRLTLGKGGDKGAVVKAFFSESLISMQVKQKPLFGVL
jgi:hypothetical protein